MEWRLFPEGTIPEWTTPEWYADREHAPHLEHEPHRSRIQAAAGMVNSLPPVTRVVDLGAGDGGLLSLLNQRLDAIGFDLQMTNVQYAQASRRVKVYHRDVVGYFPAALFDAGPERTCAVATEMLEHLVDPHGFIRTVAGYAKYLVASSPFKETGSSHYAFHTWAWNRSGYDALLAQAGYQIVKRHLVDIFQVVLAVQEEKP